MPFCETTLLLQRRLPETGLRKQILDCLSRRTHPHSSLPCLVSGPEQTRGRGSVCSRGSCGIILQKPDQRGLGRRDSWPDSGGGAGLPGGRPSWVCQGRPKGPAWGTMHATYRYRWLYWLSWKGPGGRLAAVRGPVSVPRATPRRSARRPGQAVHTGGRRGGRPRRPLQQSSPFSRNGPGGVTFPYSPIYSFHFPEKYTSRTLFAFSRAQVSNPSFLIRHRLKTFVL